MKIERNLLTRDEYNEIFLGIDEKSYSQIKIEILQNKQLSSFVLEDLFEPLNLPNSFNIIGKGDIIKKMNGVNNINLYYWEVRYFLNEAYRDSYLGYPYDAYLYRKILMLKSAFVCWLSFFDKIEKIIELKNDYPDFWEKYGKEERGKRYTDERKQTITWLNKTSTFRKFVNDIKHNHDFLSEIQIADRGHGYWSHSVNGVSVLKTGSYSDDLISNFFYHECFRKLFIAFNDLVKIVNSLPKTI